MLEVSPVRAFSDNYIWLIRTPGGPAGAAIVDPGDARPVEDALDREGLRLRADLRFAQAVEPANADGETTLEASRELRSRDEPTLPSTIDLERRIHPFLRCREPAVKAAAIARGPPVGSVEEVFAVIRSWNDGFR